jgi:hypothetical protein
VTGSQGARIDAQAFAGTQAWMVWPLMPVPGQQTSLPVQGSGMQEKRQTNTGAVAPPSTAAS